MRDTPKTQGLQLRTREMEALQWFRNGRIFKILFSGQKTLPWARFSFSAGGGHCMFALSRASDFWAFPTVSYISQQKG